MASAVLGKALLNIFFNDSTQIRVFSRNTAACYDPNHTNPRLGFDRMCHWLRTEVNLGETAVAAVNTSAILQ